LVLIYSSANVPNLPIFVAMIGERVPEGWQTRLKPSGVGRYLSAAFLIFWLCGWAVGEGFALWFLGKGILALMNGTPFDEGRALLGLGPALAIGGFLLLWLSLWTVGGIAAMGEVLRLLWSEDRLIANGGGVTVVRSRGPFRSRRELPRDVLRRILLVPRNDALVAETARERVELTRLGSHADREEIAAALRSELGITEAAPNSETAALPKGWAEIITPEGERAVAVDAATQRVRARVAGVLALIMGAVALALFGQALRQIIVLPVAIFASLGAVGLACAAVWLARGRMEWKIGSGSLSLRRRFGSSATLLFDARRLELVISRDSDGDEWFALEACRDAVAEAGPDHWMRGASKNRRRVTAALNEPTVPRLLGIWLSKTAGVPFEDRTSPEAQAAETTQLLDQLEKAGPLGRVAARFLGDAIDRRRKSA
jgi:hypothetical protein